jgi:hypothetical protein
MTMQTFAQQIEYLLFTGAIEGEEILKHYHLLKAYGQGKISAEALQTAIDDLDPDQADLDRLPEEDPPAF